MKRRCSTLSQFQYPDGVSIPRSTSEAQRSERYWQLCVDLRGRPLGAQRDTPCGISLPKPLRAKWHLTPLKLRLSSFEKFRKEGGGRWRGKGEGGEWRYFQHYLVFCREGKFGWRSMLPLGGVRLLRGFPIAIWAPSAAWNRNQRPWQCWFQEGEGNDVIHDVNSCWFQLFNGRIGTEGRNNGVWLTAEQ